MSSNNYNNFIDSANSSEPVDEPIVSTNTSEPEAQPQGPVMEDEVSTPCRQFSQSQFEASEELHTSDVLPAIYANQRPGTSRSSSNPCRQQSDTIDLVSDDDSPIPPHVSALPVSEDNIELIDLVSDSSDE